MATSSRSPRAASAPAATRILEDASIGIGDQPEHRQLQDRVHLGILKVSEGNLGKFREAARLAETDWRDLLVAAGLAEADWTRVLATHGYPVPTAP